MGPLAVRSSLQASGVGRTIVQAAVDWLRDEGVTTIGLETMPRTVDNIGFYSRLGFLPRHLTVTMTNSVRPGDPGDGFSRLSPLSEDDQRHLLQRCRLRLGRSAAGYDLTREFEITVRLRIGDAIVLQDANEVRAFALWHSAPLADERSVEELRVLKLFADSEDAFSRLLVGVEQSASSVGLPKVSFRCQTAYAKAFGVLVQRGYRVRWTDLRMTMAEFPEAEIPTDEVLYSNWEI